MALRLYNSLGRKKSVFVPLQDQLAKIYTCGPTVYDRVHIGNLRAYLTADLLRRALSHQGLKIKHVTNITDVDDKTIKASREAKTDLAGFTQKYTDSYFEDLNRLNILRPDFSPQATDYVPKMIKAIEALIEKKLAYQAEDGVYFRISAFKNYGQLVQLSAESLLQERIKNDDYDKEKAADFALWKFHTPEDGEVYWDTPFGRGRPGWHIECSVMSRQLLGQPFDIHTGGIDLLFPHHTNEIAQSESLYETRLANFWLHNEFVNVDGKKMSKSLGNTFTLDDLEKRGFHPLSFRYLTLLTHYRQKLNFTWEALEAAQSAYQRLIELGADWLEKAEDLAEAADPDWEKKFDEVVSDDLNTPEALAVLWQMIKDQNIPDSVKLATLLRADNVLGLKLKEKIEETIKDRRNIPMEVQNLVQTREEARIKKDWPKADEIRKQINKLGYLIDDTPEGPRARKDK